MPLIPIAMALAHLAPGFIHLLTGSDKAGAVAQQVVNIAQTVTGTTSPEQALAVVQADPTKLLEFQQAMEANRTELEKAYLFDVQNARAMQIAALAQDDLFSKRFVYYLAAAWSLFAMFYFVSVTFWPPPPAGLRIADTILGVLISTVLGSIIGYFYGSTKNSAEKTRLLAQAQPPSAVK